MEVEGSEVQGQPRLHNEFEGSLGYVSETLSQRQIINQSVQYVWREPDCWWTEDKPK